MKLNSLIQFESSLFFLVILSRQVFFSPRSMVLLNRHQSRWSSFPLFVLVFSLPTIVTTHSYRFFHQKFFPESSYFHHISSGGPTVPHHFQCGGGQFWAEVQDALPPLQCGWDILVPNEKGMDDAEATTSGGQGWQRTTRRPPRMRMPALAPEPLHQRP